MKIHILGAGRFDSQLAANLSQCDCLICADGGAVTAQKVGVAPNVILGDLDSITESTKRYFIEQGVEFIKFPPEKDQTDSEIAIDYAIEQGATHISLFGMMGSRFDHSLANVHLLKKIGQQGISADLIDGQCFLQVINQTTAISGEIGQTVSLIPLTEAVEGVTLQGFQYPLRDYTLRLGEPIGISNVLTQPQATVSLRQGWLLIVKNLSILNDVVDT